LALANFGIGFGHTAPNVALCIEERCRILAGGWHRRCVEIEFIAGSVPICGWSIVPREQFDEDLAGTGQAFDAFVLLDGFALCRLRGATITDERPRPWPWRLGAPMRPSQASSGLARKA
jgi:hypothetical protein